MDEQFLYHGKTIESKPEAVRGYAEVCTFKAILDDSIYVLRDEAVGTKYEP